MVFKANREGEVAVPANTHEQVVESMMMTLLSEAWSMPVSQLTHDHCYFSVSVLTPQNYSRRTKERRPRLDGRQRGL